MNKNQVKKYNEDVHNINFILRLVLSLSIGNCVEISVENLLLRF